MKNKLEEFVNRNREAFDTESPQKNIWKELELLESKTAGKVWQFLTRTKIAASLLVLLNAAVLFYLVERRDARTPALPATDQAAGTQAPAYEKELDQISKVVEMKQARLKEIEKANPVLYKTFISALDQLNTSYKQLENELANNPNKAQLLEAMIQNLSLQQELLNQQLTIYQKIKQTKHENVSKNI
ncbi:MAG: hypothetical protein V4450_14450 [Bacteroidota bacterium]